jgi:hypothetical protein
VACTCANAGQEEFQVASTLGHLHRNIRVSGFLLLQQTTGYFEVVKNRLIASGKLVSPSVVRSFVFSNIIIESCAQISARTIINKFK